jgi:hypothetical protein
MFRRQLLAKLYHVCSVVLLIVSASGVDGATSASGAAHDAEYQAGSGNAKRTLPRADFALYTYLYDLVVEP